MEDFISKYINGIYYQILIQAVFSVISYKLYFNYQSLTNYRKMDPSQVFTMVIVFLFDHKMIVDTLKMSRSSKTFHLNKYIIRFEKSLLQVVVTLVYVHCLRATYSRISNSPDSPLPERCGQISQHIPGSFWTRMLISFHYHLLFVNSYTHWSHFGSESS